MKIVRSTPVSRVLGLLVCATFIVASQRSASAQQAPTVEFFEGVWKITKVVTDGVANTSPQPGVAIFSGSYFSFTRVTSSEARPPAPPARDPAQLTDAEKIARYEEWAPFGAGAGTYELRGNTLLTHNIVAKAARNMTLTERVIIEQIDEDTFVATPRRVNRTLVGKRPTPAFGKGGLLGESCMSRNADTAIWGIHAGRTGDPITCVGLVGGSTNTSRSAGR